MSSTNEIIKNETAVIAEGKKEKKAKKPKIKYPEPEPEPEKEDLFATLLAQQQATRATPENPVVIEEEESNIKVRYLEPAKFLITNLTAVDEDEEVEIELAKRLAEVKAMRAEKAKKNQLPELRAALIAKADALLEKQVAEYHKEIADIKNGLYDDKLIKPERTKSGKDKKPVKDGAPPRVEAVMGKGSMRGSLLKSLVKANGEGVRWVKKSDGCEYGVWKKEVCRRDESGSFDMPIWADIKKELALTKDMKIELFKQQLTTA